MLHRMQSAAASRIYNRRLRSNRDCSGITPQQYTILEEVRVSFSLHGIPVSRGIAIGRAYLIAPAALDVDHYLVEPPQIEGEIERFRAALRTVQGELERLSEDLSADAPSEVGAFINVHTMILNDAMLVQETMDLIRTRRYNVEWALTEQLERLSRQFDDIEDEYLRERKADVQQVVERMLEGPGGGAFGSRARRAASIRIRATT